METELSSLLRAARERRGESLRTAARVLEVDPSYLSRVERGDRRPSHELRKRAREHYGLDSDETELAAGSLPADVLDILRANPELVNRIRDEYGNV